MMARSRSPTTLVTSMLENSSRASSAEITGVSPLVTEYFGPRTDAAGLTATTWPTTSQSKSMRIVARCCFTVGFETVRPKLLDVGGDVNRLNLREVRDAARLTPAKKRAGRSCVGRARVGIPDIDGKELDKAPRGFRAATSRPAREGTSGTLSRVRTTAVSVMISFRRNRT